MLHYDCYESPLGTLWMTGESGILTGLSFQPLMPETEHAHCPELDPVKAWLDCYFQGEVAAPDFSMAPYGTAFQQLIWQMLLKIPYGKTCTYGELAKEAASLMGKDRMSSQAVGQAVGSNPIAIIIPCHRVLGVGGKLTGYAFGIDKKQALLQHEQIREVERCVTQTSDILKQNG